MPANETGVVQGIVKAIHSHYPGSWTIKIHGSPYQPVGTPDLLCCVQGRFAAFEVKHIKPGESREHALARATPAQLEQLRRISAAGGIAAVVTSADEVLAILHEELERDC